MTAQRQSLVTNRVGRFEREAKAIARLSDPHIVVVHGFRHAGSTLFLAMELLSGTSLGERLRISGSDRGRRRQVVLTVSSTGEVSDAHFTDEATNKTSLGACIVSSLTAWKFPAFVALAPVESN